MDNPIARAKFLCFVGSFSLFTVDPHNHSAIGIYHSTVANCYLDPKTEFLFKRRTINNWRHDMKLVGNPKQGLFGATLGFFTGFAAVSLFGPTASRFQELMGLSPVLVGLLVAAPSLSGSLLRIPFGAWVDTTGGRKPFLILLWLSVVGMLGLLLVVYFLYPDQLTLSIYPVLLILGVLSGCGIATFSVGIGQVSYWFPQNKQGSALGAYAGIGNLAPGLFSFLLPIALGSWGLSGAYLTWLLFLTIGVVLYQFTGLNAYYFQLRDQNQSAEEAKENARSSGQELFPSGGTRESLIKAAKIWKTWLLVAIYFTTFGGFIALTAWFPTYWTSYYKLSAVTAGGLTALYSLTASAIRVPGGTISDRLGGEKTALISLVTMLIGAILMTTSNIYLLSIIGEILLAIGMGVTNAAVFKLMPQYISEAVGGAAGWIGGLGAFGGFAIPPIMGAFVRAQGDTGYATGFLVFVILATTSLGLAYRLKRMDESGVISPILQTE
jgi:NNP family nitrate/nitrite transporter-like MFS transporter